MDNHGNSSNLLSAGSGIDDAKTKAVIEVSSSMKQQIGLLAIGDGFALLVLCAACCLLILSFITYAPPLVPALKKAT